MRISTLTFTAAILMGIGLLSSNPTLKVPTAGAQVEGTVSPRGTSAAPPLAPATVPAIPEAMPKQLPSAAELARQAEAAMMAKLEQRIDVDYSDVPLPDVVFNLQQETGLQLLIDHTAKEVLDAQYKETHVTLKLQQLPVRRILSLILDQYELAYVPVEDGLVTITTQDVAHSQLLVRVYNCRDILYSSPHFLGTQPGADQVPTPLAGGMPGMMGTSGMGSMGSGGIAMMPGMPGGMPGAAMSGGMSGMPMGGGPPTPPTPATDSAQEYRAKRLMNLLTTTVGADSWVDAGGMGSVSEFDGLIVINQTSEVHQGIENVLTMLRTTAAETKASAVNPPAKISNGESY